MKVASEVPYVSTSMPNVTSVAAAKADLSPPAVKVGPGGEPPVKKIDPDGMRQFGQKLDMLFRQYISDRRIAELRWLMNERQYLGIYDPEIESQLAASRSRAYPRLTRVKAISVLARLMNLMFPGNERNWEIKSSPNPDMDEDSVRKALQEALKRDQEEGTQRPHDLDYVMSAMKQYADEQAEKLCIMIDDQLQELGGNQTLDYINLCRKVLQSGIIYGLGILRGPYARECKAVVWNLDNTGTPKPTYTTVYKPMFEFLKVWDFYPDLAAKTFREMDGYFTREVMSRAQVRALAQRKDFFEEQIKNFLKNHQMGNYRPQPFETELRALGVKVNVNEMKTETSKYEVITWRGQTSGSFLSMCGIAVPEDKLADDLDAEVWMIDGNVIKAVLDPWASLGVENMKTVHTFLFDEDDTSPVGFGLPNAMRDSQMAVSAATRMLLDNASVVCGPNLELNTDLLRADQDLTSTTAYKIWYREGTGADAQQPAVRNVQIDSHLDDLMKIVDMFMKFADQETFVGPATGGDMEKGPSEPMRTAAGASMIRGDAALPFKDIVRNFDTFTQSVIESIVWFNRKFNPDECPDGDFDIIARGATSLVAKEVRGLQMDQLAVSLTEKEWMHVDERKFAKQRLLVRDMGDLMVSDEEAERRQMQSDQQAAAQQKSQQELVEANIRKLLSDAFKNIAQGQKNTANADAAAVDTALALMEQGLTGGTTNGGQAAGATGDAQGAQPSAPNGGAPDQAGGGPPPQPAGGGAGPMSNSLQ